MALGLLRATSMDIGFQRNPVEVPRRASHTRLMRSMLMAEKKTKPGTKKKTGSQKPQQKPEAETPLMKTESKKPARKKY